MTVAEEAGELRNPGLPGNEEFDTLIYGSLKWTPDVGPGIAGVKV